MLNHTNVKKSDNLSYALNTYMFKIKTKIDS